MKTLLLPIALLFMACSSLPKTSAPPSGDVLHELEVALTGQFSSAAQAAADPDNYFDIRLKMTPIWTERTDGPWLYVEQAVATSLERPYRQRVYHLVLDPDEGLRSDVLTLPGDPLAFVGAWRDPDLLADYDPEDLSPRTGCSIYLDRVGPGTFAGGTFGEGCTSNLGDAAFATSEVTLEPGLVTSWDRGWTEAGEQAWGAELGPYEFLAE